MIDKRNAVGLHMPTETSARVQAQQQDTPDEREYQTFCAALGASARGRAFLAEFARRNCNSDTGPLLAAVERMRSSLAVDTAEPGEALIKQKLRALLDDIDAAQSELEANIQATRSAKLAELVALVGRRIADIMTPAQVATAPEEATELPAGREQSAEEPRAHLAVVPVPEQPELPIPAPASAQVPPIALVHTTDAAMAEVGFVNDLPAPENAVPPGATEAPEPALSDDTPPANPFASIMALSDEERLAMFT